MGTPSFRSLWRSSGLGIGAPVRVPPAGGPRPTRPSGLRADTLPTLCGGGAAARHAQPPAGSGRGNVAAKAAPAARPGQVGRQPLRGGTPPQCKAKPLRGGPLARPCIAPPPRRLRRRCSGAARPPQVGALGPSAPPARAAALRPALPARPRLRRRPCRAALPTHSPPGVAGPRPSPLPAAKPGRALRPAALPLRGPAICTAARTGGASAASPRIRARRGAGNAACGRECRPLPRPARPRQAPRRAAGAAHKRGPCLPVPRPAMGNRGGCPALCGPPAPSHSGKRWCFLCLLLLVVSLLLAGSGGWSAVLVVSLAGRCPGLPGRSGPLLWRRLLPVSWRRRALGLSGLLVLLSVGWLLFGVGSGPALGAVPCRWRPPLWVLSLAADLGRSGPDRRQV